MKRWIKAASDDRVIFEDENFKFMHDSGIGVENTPWTGLTVVSKGLAEKHVVSISLRTSNHPAFDGEPVAYEYSGATVSHGMRMMGDTLEDTAEYIEVLQDALDFAYRVNDWLARNQ